MYRLGLDFLNNTRKRFLQVAIDGPAGAGKSTVARQVAEKLGFYYLDTGAMYRVVAYKVLRSGVSLDDEKAVTEISKKTKIIFNHDDNATVFCDGEDVTSQIRSTEVSRAVSVVASYAGVRDHLLELQRLEAAQGDVVMDGRDIGTYVLPEAQVKIYLTASTAERAKRRTLENRKKRIDISYEEVLADIVRRDQLDSERKHAPLKPAEDAIILDTTGLSIEEVVAKIVKIIRED